MLSRLLLLVLVLLLSSCVPGSGKRPLKLSDTHIAVDTTWQGSIVIDGSVKVAKGAKLTILPGAEISFVRRDKDADGLGDGTLAVEGELVALGKPDAPIVFRSAEENPQPGDWLEVRVDFSKNAHFRHCEFRDAAYTLHAHFTRGVLEDSYIHGNIDGCRLGETSFVIRNNIFERNQGKAINFRNASIEVTHNIIRHNGSGIFLFESDRKSTISRNNLHDNLDNIRLGDFFRGDVYLTGNWWGSADADEIGRTIYDSRVDPEIGTVHIDAADAWVKRTGPREQFELKELWSYGTEGFVDATIISVGDLLIVCSWDGTVTALNGVGRKLWSRQLGDVIDATPASDGERLFVQTWGRDLFALDAASGSELWRFSYSPSPADDHRQGGLTVSRETVYLPAWNGSLYALDALSGKRLWAYDAGQPLRSAVAVDEDRLYVASGSGQLSALQPDGQLLWQLDLGEPLLAQPTLTPLGPVVISKRGELHALDRRGQVRWQKSLGEVCFYGSALVDDGLLYIGTTAGSLWKIDMEHGRTIWRQEGLGPIYTTPRRIGRRLLVGDNDGNLSVLGLDSGTVISQFRLDGSIQGDALVHNGLYIVGGRERSVYALKPVVLAESEDAGIR